MSTKKIAGIIPARYKSTRFPGKPLTELLGKPMILWVAEIATKALGRENVYVATEDERICKVVSDGGFKAILTSDVHATGTDRLAEAAANIDADYFINIQGDEPTVDPKVINQVIELKLQHPNFIINAMAKLNSHEDPNNVNIPKVIFNENYDLVYMSRVAIPGTKKIEDRPKSYYKQVCIYAFTKDELLKFNKYGRKSILESYEDIEILRYLELGIPVKMIEVEGNSFAVDIEEDIPIVENRLKEIHNL